MNLANWVEARRVLAPLARGFASARVCTLMAEIEQGQRHDASAAHGWLERAVRAPRDAEWRCAACGWSCAKWRAICGACGAFDSLAWTAPATGLIEHYDASADDEHDGEFHAGIIEGQASQREPEPAGDSPQPPRRPPPPTSGGKSQAREAPGYVVLPRAPDDPGPESENFDETPSAESRRGGPL